MPTSFLVRPASRTFFALAALALAAPAQTIPPDAASNDSVSLAQIVTSASRTPQEQRTMPSSVSVLSLAELKTEQVFDLHTALSQVPGLSIVNTGAFGGQSSVFLRGSSAHQTLFVVDGVRMNDRSATYLNFLGGSDLLGIDRVEVLRGPQSTLYGSSAMGGVILIDTAHGAGAPHGALAATAGSFETFGGSAEIAGGTPQIGYSASLARLTTENDRPNNGYKQWSYSARLESPLTETLLVGATFRGQNGDYDEAGSTLFLSPGRVEADNALATVYAQARVNEDVTSRFTAALHRREYEFSSAFGVSKLRNTRQILDWQTTWAISPRAELVGGANYEKSRFVVNGSNTNDELGALFLSGIFHPLRTVTLTGGLRVDDTRSAGSAVTGRAGLAWLPVETTKLRATLGTGFSAPGSDDRYGVPDFGQLSNPNLKPEKSRGWDLGLDQSFAQDAITISATYFKNRFTNLFEFAYVDFVTFQGRTVNRAKASTDGAEFAVAAKLNASVNARLSYTYLDAVNDENGQRLARRPRHTLDGEIRVQATSAWKAGAGLHIVADRVDTAGALEDYTTARLFTSYAVHRNLLLKARLENALDEKYAEVRGYPALPRGVFGSVEWKF